MRYNISLSSVWLHGPGRDSRFESDLPEDQLILVQLRKEIGTDQRKSLLLCPDPFLSNGQMRSVISLGRSPAANFKISVFFKLSFPQGRELQSESNMSKNSCNMKFDINFVSPCLIVFCYILLKSPKWRLHVHL